MHILKNRNVYITLILAMNALLNADQALVSIFTEDEYARVEKVFANNTGHIDHIVDFILSKAGAKKSFLDIGAGPATIIERVSHSFESTTIVEPNKAFVPLYKDKSFAYHIENFQDFPVDHKYDFVLCSHVLYHVPRPQWTSFLKKMHEVIASGGRGLVAMVAPKGKFHELRSSINPDYSNSSQVEQSLKQLGISYELFPVQSIFKVSNYADFRALVRLFTLDDCFLPEEYTELDDSVKVSIDQKIEAYIAMCKQPDGSFEFLDEDVYILMQRIKNKHE